MGAKPSLAFRSFILLFLDRLSLRSRVGRPKIPGFTVDICRLIIRFVKWLHFSTHFSWEDKGNYIYIYIYTRIYENETIEVFNRYYRKLHLVSSVVSSFPQDNRPKERALKEQAVAFGCRLEHPLKGHGRNLSKSEMSSFGM